MRKRDKAELDPHFPVRLETETPEAVVGFDVTEDGLWLDGASVAVHHPAFAGKQFPSALLEGIGPMVDLYGPAVDDRVVAHSPERASLATDGPVNGRFRTVSEI